MSKNVNLLREGVLLLQEFKNWVLKNKLMVLGVVSGFAIFIAVILGISLSNSYDVQETLNNRIYQYESQETEIKNSLASIEDKEAELQKKEAEFQQQKAKFDEDKASYEKSLAELNAKTEEFNKYKNDCSSLQQKNAELEKNYNSLKSNYDKVVSENTSLKNKVSTMSSSSSSSYSSSSTASSYSSNSSSDDNQSYTVYVTKTGAKYHSGGCRYLRKSKIAISKSSAVSQGYDACSVCNP